MDQCPASAAHTGQTGGAGDQWFLCSASVVGQREVRIILHAGSRAEVGNSLDPISCSSEVERLLRTNIAITWVTKSNLLCNFRRCSLIAGLCYRTEVSEEIVFFAVLSATS
jgi:hypothetical protein